MTAARRILLTGGTGYIGSHTAAALAATGAQPVLFDNLCNSDAGVVERLRRITNAPVAFIEGDVRDFGAVRSALEGCGAVLHFAGLKAVGESVARPLDYYDTNVGGTATLLRAMDAAGVRDLVFSSSATVYGAPRYLPMDEGHPTGAGITNPYGRTKHQIEGMLADLAASDGRWRITALRYFNPVGAHASAEIGEDPRGEPNNLMPYVARVAAGLLPELRVFGGDYDTPDGTGVRDYIHVVDLAEGHVAALARLAHGFDVINLGTGTGHSVLEVVRAFEAASGRSVPYRIYNRRSGDVATCYANPEKAARVLGWRARLGLADMCASAWAFQTRHA
jgi:UDP-glucose 4-epimerase